MMRHPSTSKEPPIWSNQMQRVILQRGAPVASLRWHAKINNKCTSVCEPNAWPTSFSTNLAILWGHLFFQSYALPISCPYSRGRSASKGTRDPTRRAAATGRPPNGGKWTHRSPERTLGSWDREKNSCEPPTFAPRSEVAPHMAQIPYRYPKFQQQSWRNSRNPLERRYHLNKPWTGSNWRMDMAQEHDLALDIDQRNRHVQRWSILILLYLVDFQSFIWTHSTRSL